MIHTPDFKTANFNGIFKQIVGPFDGFWHRIFWTKERFWLKTNFWLARKNSTFSDQNGDMFYSVLWLPPRYKVLCLYLLLIPVVIGLIAIDKGTVYPQLIIRLNPPSADARWQITRNKLDIQYKSLNNKVWYLGVSREQKK